MVFTNLVYCRLQKIHRTHSRNFYRILKTKENSFPGPVFCRHLQQIFTIEFHFSLGNLKTFTTGKHSRKRTLSGTVRSHDCMNFSGFDFQINAFQYFFAIYRGM